MNDIISVSQLNLHIQHLLQADPRLENVAIRGEISNYKLYPSGHHYFSLKDEGGALKCVMFKGNAFRLRFRPENGMKVVATGRVDVYPRDGAYQLYCTSLMPDGVGDLHAAFEQLKARLAARGLFDAAHKKPLPAYPRAIGIVTSAAGAALHDMLRILSKRYPLAKVRLFPARVQGAEAPGEIAEAIRYANRHQLADVLIVGRGGGSMEDLWAFNDEQVALAIYNSGIPVVSAVGHEPDVTIADYVADVRAATPSNAAELVVKDQLALRQMLDQQLASIASALQKQLVSARKQLNYLASTAALRQKDHLFMQKRQQLLHIKDALAHATAHKLEAERLRFAGLATALDAMSPLKVIGRGYSVTTDQLGNVISRTDQLNRGDRVDIKLSNGVAGAVIESVKEDIYGS